MKIRTYVILFGMGYYYFYLKNNQPPSNDIELINQGGTLASQSNISEILVNSIPVSNARLYQLVYDVVDNNKRSTLYVLKDWTRLDVPKPFITQIEYNVLTDVQKQKYNLNPSIAGDYRWYQVDKLSDAYTITQNDPLIIDPNIQSDPILSKALPLGSIQIEPVNASKSTLLTSDQGVNISTPVNSATMSDTISDGNLGLTVPLSNVQKLREILYSMGIHDLYSLGTSFISGEQVNKYIITPALTSYKDIYTKLVNSNILYDVKMLATDTFVKSANTTHPDPLASQL